MIKWSSIGTIDPLERTTGNAGDSSYPRTFRRNEQDFSGCGATLVKQMVVSLIWAPVRGRTWSIGIFLKVS